jgi:hypothetical protein
MNGEHVEVEWIIANSMTDAAASAQHKNQGARAALP